jgi:Elongation factor Tu GTP binding domain
MLTHAQPTLCSPQPAGAERMHIVVTGHVDHGKSTIVGRLLAETGSVPAEKLETIRLACERSGKRFEHAFLLDALRTNRHKASRLMRLACSSRAGGATTSSSMRRDTRNSSRTWSLARHVPRRRCSSSTHSKVFGKIPAVTGSCCRCLASARLRFSSTRWISSTTRRRCSNGWLTSANASFRGLASRPCGSSR